MPVRYAVHVEMHANCHALKVRVSGGARVQVVRQAPHPIGTMCGGVMSKYRNSVPQHGVLWYVAWGTLIP